MAEVNCFEELVLPHLDAAHNMARWLTRNRDDARGLLQRSPLMTAIGGRTSGGQR